MLKKNSIINMIYQYTLLEKSLKALTLSHKISNIVHQALFIQSHFSPLVHLHLSNSGFHCGLCHFIHTEKLQIF